MCMNVCVRDTVLPRPVGCAAAQPPPHGPQSCASWPGFPPAHKNEAPCYVSACSIYSQSDTQLHSCHLMVHIRALHGQVFLLRIKMKQPPMSVHVQFRVSQIRSCTAATSQSSTVVRFMARFSSCAWKQNIEVISRVGQNRIYTPYMTIYFVISLSKIPYIHRIYIVLANPSH